MSLNFVSEDTLEAKRKQRQEEWEKVKRVGMICSMLKLRGEEDAGPKNESVVFYVVATLIKRI